MLVSNRRTNCYYHRYNLFNRNILNEIEYTDNSKSVLENLEQIKTVYRLLIIVMFQTQYYNCNNGFSKSIQNTRK